MKHIILKRIKYGRGFKTLIQCNRCSKEKWVKQSDVNKGYYKFCSIKCANKFRVGSKNPRWKGGIASYVVRHDLIRKQKGKAKICVDCSVTYKERRIEWSNIDHKYSRNLNDYSARCCKCHQKYDKKMKKEEEEGSLATGL